MWSDETSKGGQCKMTNNIESVFEVERPVTDINIYNIEISINFMQSLCSWFALSQSFNRL